MTDDPLDELLRAVFLAPADNATRLVLADYLMDRGDPRGELIQIQCTLATATGDRHAELSARERELLSVRQPPPGTQVSYARGLCDSAIVDVSSADAAIPYLAGELVIHDLLLNRIGSDAQWNAIGRLIRAVSNAVRTIRFDGSFGFTHHPVTGDSEQSVEQQNLVRLLRELPRPKYLVDVDVPIGTQLPSHWVVRLPS